jgi:hypothetical protein
MCGAPRRGQRGWSTCTPNRVHIPDVLSSYSETDPVQTELTLLIPRIVVGRQEAGASFRKPMELQEGGCGVAGTSRDFAGIRSLGDAEQQADLQIAPEQPGKLPSKFGRTAC